MRLDYAEQDKTGRKQFNKLQMKPRAMGTKAAQTDLQRRCSSSVRSPAREKQGPKIELDKRENSPRFSCECWPRRRRTAKCFLSVRHEGTRELDVAPGNMDEIANELISGIEKLEKSIASIQHEGMRQ